MTDPYRDENTSLRAENERLRADLAKRHRASARRGLTVFLVALDFGAIVALRPWLNGGSDAAFWGAFVIVVGIALAAVASAFVGRRH